MGILFPSFLNSIYSVTHENWVIRNWDIKIFKKKIYAILFRFNNLQQFSAFDLLIIIFKLACYDTFFQIFDFRINFLYLIFCHKFLRTFLFLLRTFLSFLPRIDTKVKLIFFLFFNFPSFLFFMALYANNKALLCGRSIQIGIFLFLFSFLTSHTFFL